MAEIVTNLHMHTTYSDGCGTHAEIAQAAINSGVPDVVIVTDHNVYVQDVEKYYEQGGRKVLLLVGEEIHDQARDPQKNHLLAFNANRELATCARHPQILINQVTKSGGLSFLAHPIDPAMPAFNETDISWESWDVHGYTGIELWNGFSELKTLVRTKLDGMYYVLFPELMAHAPIQELLEQWDSFLAAGQKVVAIGGSDAHALVRSLGPIKKTVFPYEYHFSTINTHLITPQALTGDLLTDKKMVYKALAQGNCFIGNDMIAPTRGFRFTAQGRDCHASMGDDISTADSITLQVRLPYPANISLIRNGELIMSWYQREICTLTTQDVGAYRVEVYTAFRGKQRGWIYSNPIYLRTQ